MSFPPLIPVGTAPFFPSKKVGVVLIRGYAKGRKGEVSAEICHAYINDRAWITFRGLLRF
jgi:hypothetical protein